MKYRNVRHGRVVERPGPDEWLEASAGWERVETSEDLMPDGTFGDGANSEADSEEEEE